jgi:hypothetical protein
MEVVSVVVSVLVPEEVLMVNVMLPVVTACPLASVTVAETLN